jgi:hypothetical protein
VSVLEADPVDAESGSDDDRLKSSDEADEAICSPADIPRILPTCAHPEGSI